MRVRAQSLQSEKGVEERWRRRGRSRPVNVTSATAFSKLQMGLTEIRRAIPVQLPPVPIVDSIPYEASAPRGVDKLKYAICFRHSERGRELDIRDMDNASAVGAKDASV